ncbi:hypothetical protein TWF730_005892 [Orbilia blumenaviensis]|uniref:Uncharacterized protein n=1 Tax=Orbilia blumenaviensis TaxID=1796055 RepID=A0AAV9VLX4_9PEZI
MRPASIKRAIPSLLAFTLAVNALPSGGRQDDVISAPPTSSLGSSAGLRKAVDRLIEDMKKVQKDGSLPPVQARDLEIEGSETFHIFGLSKKSPTEEFINSIPLEGLLEPRIPHTEPPEGLNAGFEDAEQPDSGAEYLEKREPEPDVVENGSKKVKRSSESQDLKAKLRARAETEREAEEYESAKRIWEERTAHNKRVRHHNLKRLFQKGSPFQEYHNTVPNSAYAADDGSFGHSLPVKRRSLLEKAHDLQRKSQGPDNGKELANRQALKARLQELGYTPEADTAEPVNGAEKMKRDENSVDGTTRWNHSPFRKRNLEQHIACPGLGLMSSIGNIFEDPGSFFWDISEYRDSCFNCACTADRGGFFIALRPEGGCTRRLVENCIMSGCRCLSTIGSSNELLVPKPVWIASSKDSPATFSSGTYNPQTKTTYSDKFAAAARVNEVPFSGFKSKRHLQSPNLSHVSELFPSK